ncbi:MAG: DNA polymerase, partial [Planctomycetota bacterium]|nr:DNA polymerase [Planctomycetota bacterium]
AEAESKIHAFKGEPFNIRSTATLGALLFDELELHKAAGRKKPKKTAKGTGYATDESTLAELAPYHELPKLVLTYRSLTKLKSTYLDTLPTYVNPETGRVHTSFHQTGAATGRLSSSDPNLQNIPIRSEEGRAIRRAFVPDEGHLFLSADYSQIELRLLAHLSGDDGLKEAFVNGEDIHRATAARIFKTTPEEVTPILRSRAKAVNFGVIYGMGPQRLARETSVTMQEARQFIDDYFATYPAVKAFQERTIEDATETGYVTTLLGRRRYLPDLQSKDQRVFAQARNVAVNTPLQGTAADLIKIAMIRIDELLRTEGYDARMLLQIHDELLFEAPEAEMERLTAMVVAAMQEAMPLDVPIVVDTGVGANWSEAH